MLGRLGGLLNYLRVFPNLSDIRAFRSIAYRDGNEPVVVRTRATGNVKLHIRPHTSDAAVLWDTFHEQFHLPPIDLPPNPVVVDLGANVGYTAVHFAKRYAGATVVAVEMDIRNCEAARRHIEQVNGCRLVHAAVWSSNGNVGYDANQEAWGFHVDAQPAGNSVVVAAKTMTTILAENDLKKVDYVKMDIEGAEWPVLSSGAEWLPQVRSLKVELHPKFNKEATYENCAAVLRNCGFVCERDSRHWDTLTAVRA